MKTVVKNSSRCPFGFGNMNKNSISLAAKLYNKVNCFFLKHLGALWFPQYIGPKYPGIIAHQYKNIGIDFHTETLIKGEPASTYFEKSGIRNFAAKNGGVCSFKMRQDWAIYQVTNMPLVEDSHLSPSTGPNKRLFGNFMGTYHSNDHDRKLKRQVLLKKLASTESLNELQPHIKKHIKEYLSKSTDTELGVEDFTAMTVAYVDSFLPGILDVTEIPLTKFLRSEKYGKTIREFFELASDVISKLDSKALGLVDSITPFIRDLLMNNFNSINNAPDTNIFKQYFKLANLEFNMNGIKKAPDSLLKELGTIVVAIFDTTSLSLYWLICNIENNKEIKRKIIEEAKKDVQKDEISYIELVILENIRLAGGNPTALWREIIIPTDIEIKGVKIHLRKGTKLWLDRRAANQDPDIFPYPKDFNPYNIEYIFKNQPKAVSSIIGNNKNEINSFSMVNTFNNPRKCPGRFFSVLVQSCFIREIYGNYEVKSKDTQTELRRFCSMPRPDNNAKITLKIKT